MFYLSIKIQYGIYLLITLAKSKRRMSLKNVAKEGKMPYRFLTKIVQDLIGAGLIKAKEGRGGGYSLTKKPSNIKMKAVLNALGEPIEISRCLADRYCSNEKNCKLKPVWLRIKKYIDKEMKQITLKDLL